MFWLALACTGSSGDTDSTTTHDTDTQAVTLVVANVEVNDCKGDSSATESISASASDPGKVVVAHLAFPADCCLSFGVTASTDPETDTIAVTYTPQGDPCDCRCTYDLGYRLEGVPAGDWTVDAEGATTTVTVH